MADEQDPIADTGMFRAFVERAEAEPGTRPRGALVAAVLVAVVAVVVIAALLLR